MVKCGFWSFVLYVSVIFGVFSDLLLCFLEGVVLHVGVVLRSYGFPGWGQRDFLIYVVERSGAVIGVCRDFRWTAVRYVW